jgi:hypothetical protein
MAGAAVAALIAGGGTYALAGQGSSTLSACVHRHGGALYEAKKCAKHDRRLTWSIAGPEGPAGPAGSSGPAGANGKSGNNGADGTDGSNGIGATTSRVALTLADTEDLAALGTTGEVYGACNQSGGDVISLVGISAEVPWQVSGSYSTYQLQSNGTAIVANGSATPALGNYAIASSGNATTQTVAYTLVPTSAPGLVSGQMHVTLGSGTAAAGYEVSFEIYTEPGATGSANLCQGEVTVYPSS